MSVAEIADNKWELEASKPPLKEAGSIFQLAIMGMLCCLFLGIVGIALSGLIGGDQGGGLADKYKNMNNSPDGAAAAAEAPAGE